MHGSGLTVRKFLADRDSGVVGLLADFAGATIERRIPDPHQADPGAGLHVDGRFVTRLVVGDVRFPRSNALCLDVERGWLEFPGQYVVCGVDNAAGGVLAGGTLGCDVDGWRRRFCAELAGQPTRRQDARTAAGQAYDPGVCLGKRSGRVGWPHGVPGQRFSLPERLAVVSA